MSDLTWMQAPTISTLTRSELEDEHPPLCTEEDYREALARVDELWDRAEPGTPEGDEVDATITLIQAYEREHYPVPPPDPCTSCETEGV